MDHSTDWINVVFGLLFASGGAAIVIFYMRLYWFRRTALARGLMAEARCVQTFETEERDSDGDKIRKLHMILAFRTRDGANVRLERIVSVHATTGVHFVGDVVPVRYLPEHPERATVTAPGAGQESCVMGCGVVIGLLLACAGLFGAAVQFGFAP
ncbi:DUF3592 domain-containing protein [Streptomyces sp. NPDC090493]|uniref:DUF3592 domain-containing protein n=1 Tax=Streptomyces sp. NPDC090493 TaxID=3365964 RepID=UPI0037FC11EB